MAVKHMSGSSLAKPVLEAIWASALETIMPVGGYAAVDLGNVDIISTTSFPVWHVSVMKI